MPDSPPENVAYGGQCAFAMSLNKKDEPESGKHQLTIDGRTFYFKNAVAKFLHKTFNRTARADEHWERHAG